MMHHVRTYIFVELFTSIGTWLVKLLLVYKMLLFYLQSTYS